MESRKQATMSDIQRAKGMGTKKRVQRMQQGLAEAHGSLGGSLGRGQELVRVCEVPGAIVGGMEEQGSLESSPWGGLLQSSPNPCAQRPHPDPAHR